MGKLYRVHHAELSGSQITERDVERRSTAHQRERAAQKGKASEPREIVAKGETTRQRVADEIGNIEDVDPWRSTHGGHEDVKREKPYVTDSDCRKDQHKGKG